MAASAPASAPPVPQGLEFVPDNITFFCGNPGKSTYCDIKVTNKNAKRAVFKYPYFHISTVSLFPVRCTSAAVFRVQPPTGFIAKDQTAIIRLWFQNRRFIESTRHYFAVHVVFNDTVVKATDAFPKGVKPDGVKRLSVAFSKAVPPALSAGEEPAIAPKSLMAAPSIMPSVLAPAPGAAPAVAPTSPGAPPAVAPASPGAPPAVAPAAPAATPAAAPAPTPTAK